MFERFTEKARRVIFFARYEASQFGASGVDADHILLGLLREENCLCGKWLPNADANSIRARIESWTTKHFPISTSVDMPLTSAGKMILADAVSEADLLNSKQVGTQHFLLALLNQPESPSGHLLRQLGADIATLREKFAK